LSRIDLEMGGMNEEGDGVEEDGGVEEEGNGCAGEGALRTV
jgi:hypothetical protein